MDQGRPQGIREIPGGARSICLTALTIAAEMHVIRLLNEMFRQRRLIIEDMAKILLRLRRCHACECIQRQIAAWVLSDPGE